MSIARIQKKTVTTAVYVGSSGKETPVSELADKHLLNALLVAQDQDNTEVIETLFNEALRRMKHQ